MRTEGLDLPLGLRSLDRDRPVVILTGAGISVESGIPAFRGGSGSIWERYDLDAVATHKALKVDPGRVKGFVEDLRAFFREHDPAPNPAHLALAKLQEKLPCPVEIITQNIDDLHERAGSPTEHVWHIHGRLFEERCDACDASWPCGSKGAHPCSGCLSLAHVRPDLVLFGEDIRHGPEVREVCRHAQLFVAIGTSGTVEPAGSLVKIARYKARARTLCIGAEVPENVRRFDRFFKGLAGDLTPKLVAALLRLGGESVT